MYYSKECELAACTSCNMTSEGTNCLLGLKDLQLFFNFFCDFFCSSSAFHVTSFTFDFYSTTLT